MNDDPLAAFEKLAAAARAEPPPGVELSRGVLASVRGAQATPAVAHEYWAFAVGSALAACAAGILFWFDSSDSTLLGLSQSFVTVLQ